MSIKQHIYVNKKAEIFLCFLCKMIIFSQYAKGHKKTVPESQPKPL